MQGPSGPSLLVLVDLLYQECKLLEEALAQRGERAQRRGSRKTPVFLSRETGISGNFVGRIKGAKCPFDLQFLTWDFS